jgi:hypothetical protein
LSRKKEKERQREGEGEGRRQGGREAGRKGGREGGRYRGTKNRSTYDPAIPFLNIYPTEMKTASK